MGLNLSTYKIVMKSVLDRGVVELMTATLRSGECPVWRHRIAGLSPVDAKNQGDTKADFW